MKNKTVYDLVVTILRDTPQARNSDKVLLWAVWTAQGIAGSAMTYQNFINGAATAESVTRARRKVVENHPELAPTSEKVKQLRQEKEQTGGNFVYHEPVQSGLFN